MNRSPALTITLIMPAYNAAHLLPQVLAPLLAMQAAGEIDEVLLVDDQSTDDTAAVARAMGATVLVTPQNGGPGSRAIWRQKRPKAISYGLSIPT